MKKVKFCALILALVMAIGIFAGCKDSAKVVQNGGKYTYWTVMDSETAQTLTSYNEMLMYQEMEKRTGTKVEFIHPVSGSTGGEAFQVMLASGDFPDMIEHRWNTYPGGPDQAVNDGVIIRLNDYLEDYAPNYYDYMEGEKGKENGYLYKAQALTYEGNYYGFMSLNIGSYRGFGGLYVRKDMLDKWGVDIPETIDEWEHLLKTAKENGCRIPLTGVNNLFSILGIEVFNSAWNVGKDWYIDGKTVKFGPFQPEYKEYIERMSEWVKAGYVDMDYITNDAAVLEGNMTNGTSVAAYGNVGGGLGKLLPAMEDRDPNYSLAACPYPVLKKGDVPKLRDLQAESKEPTIVITTQCGEDDENRYKEAIKWCDYFYSDEGMILKLFGVEGETFTVEKDQDGETHYVYTDAIYDHEKIGAHSVAAALYHFFRPGGPGFCNHPDYLDGYYPYEAQKDAIKVWNRQSDEAREHMYPAVTYTGDETVEKANTEANWRANIDAAVSNAILGKITLKEYDEIMQKAAKDGYNDLIKIQQNAYDRYLELVK